MFASSNWKLYLVVMALNSSVSWCCYRWVISLELGFSRDHVVVCFYISSPLGADVLQGSSKGTGDTDMINRVPSLMVC